MPLTSCVKKSFLQRFNYFLFGFGKQMRCRDAKVCSNRGVRVVLTDFHTNNRTDFLLGGPAFVGLAKPGMAQQLRRLGALSIQYKRIPCDYSDKNLSILVEEQSKKPSKLVIKFLYQGGQTDILAVDVAQVGSSDWRFMSRLHGPVWSTDRAPTGPLQFRAVVTGGYDGKWVWADKEVLPANWQPGQVYDTGARIDDVARESCLGCTRVDWEMKVA
uniref:Uncharacterized protein n=1 Tax=Avena sativa TaxID=4498 RepID=A0ACD5UMI3_AVESA